jgi:hypothetical protein
MLTAAIVTSRPVAGSEPVHRDATPAKPASLKTARQTGHSTDSVSPEWFERQLPDPDLGRFAAERYAEHHRLLRSDMLAIFSMVVESGTVDDEQFETLRRIVDSAGRLGMPPNVADLARKVVFGDPANAHFQGEPLGNLKADPSAEVLDKLVKKWFLGQDLPKLDSKYHYVKAAGKLFDGPPTLFDLHQGDLGDCYFVATLGELALRDPAQINRMFSDNLDGTFTVRFFNNNRRYFVTVDRQLPVDSKGRFVYDNRGDLATNPKNVLWVALAEKALAQLNESGWLATAGKAGENSFAAIGAGGKSKLAVSLVTGQATNRDDLKSIGSFAKGELEIANSKNDVPSFLVPHHSYVVVDYNADRGEVTLFNPWGLHGNKKDIKYGQFTMSWTDFWSDFQNIDHAPHHLIASGGATKRIANNLPMPKAEPNSAGAIAAAR